jgi:release factor glutamine methyltransferase
MTLREALAQGAALLKLSHIDTPALDASLLLAEILHTSRAGLIAAGPDPLSAENYRSFQALLERRLSGECVAYILGRREFRGLDFTVTPAVLVPRPDTETLVEAALGLLGHKFADLSLIGHKAAAGGDGAAAPLSLLDLCTGSGAVAVSIKHEAQGVLMAAQGEWMAAQGVLMAAQGVLMAAPELEVWASDISEAALNVARANAARLLRAGPDSETGSVEQPVINFVNSDLFSHISGSFNFIVSNPPYVRTEEIQTLQAEVKREPLLALDGGKDGLDIIRRLITEAPSHLLPGGWLLLEADPRQMKVIRGLLETKGYNDIQTYRDLPGQERVIGARINGV